MKNKNVKIQLVVDVQGQKVGVVLDHVVGKSLMDARFVEFTEEPIVEYVMNTIKYVGEQEASMMSKMFGMMMTGKK